MMTATATPDRAALDKARQQMISVLRGLSELRAVSELDEEIQGGAATVARIDRDLASAKLELDAAFGEVPSRRFDANLAARRKYDSLTADRETAAKAMHVLESRRELLAESARRAVARASDQLHMGRFVALQQELAPAVPEGQRADHDRMLHTELNLLVADVVAEALEPVRTRKWTAPE